MRNTVEHKYDYYLLFQFPVFQRFTESPVGQALFFFPRAEIKTLCRINQTQTIQYKCKIQIYLHITQTLNLIFSSERSTKENQSANVNKI